ncbi:MAG TPA: hypothetical protein V6C65_03835 [Allocoleopsis sp.]
MNTLNSKLKQSPVSTSLNHHTEEFDFDRWASQVKQQMIACLKRRGAA